MYTVTVILKSKNLWLHLYPNFSYFVCCCYFVCYCALLIIRFIDLDLEKLAECYALLKLPKMPELKNKAVKSFVSVDVNYEEIPYLWVFNFLCLIWPVLWLMDSRNNCYQYVILLNSFVIIFFMFNAILISF